MPKNFLVVDLEATCSDDGSIPKRSMEIIEIGAVLVDGQTLSPIDEYQTFVRPVRNQRLTEFCTQLTSISQAEVDDAPGFPEVATSMKRWMYGSAAFTFCSWGDYDRTQFEQDCDFHRLPYLMPGGHLNLKKAFSEHQGVTKKFGMAGALKRVDLSLIGTHHRGIDDARNIARLLPWCIEATERR